MKTAPGDLQVFKAEFFRALAHPVRIRILEALVPGELSVGEIQRRLGLEQSLVSQQLSLLRAKNIVTARKDGTTVRYSLRDPLLANLLEVARQVFNNHLVDTQTLLQELHRERRQRCEHFRQNVKRIGVACRAAFRRSPAARLRCASS
jgi:ArsR family transcriptional regulator